MTKDEVELVRKLAARVQHNDRGYDGYDESLPSCGGLIDGSSGAWIKPCTCGLQPLLDQLERLTVEPSADGWRACAGCPTPNDCRMHGCGVARNLWTLPVNRQAEPAAGRCPTCSRWLEQRCPVCGPVERAEPNGNPTNEDMEDLQSDIARLEGEVEKEKAKVQGAYADGMRDADIIADRASQNQAAEPKAEPDYKSIAERLIHTLSLVRDTNCGRKYWDWNYIEGEVNEAIKLMPPIPGAGVQLNRSPSQS